jgi:hypothetical protein
LDFSKRSVATGHQTRRNDLIGRIVLSSFCARYPDGLDSPSVQVSGGFATASFDPSLGEASFAGAFLSMLRLAHPAFRQTRECLTSTHEIANLETLSLNRFS